MAETAGEGLAVLYDTAQTGYSPISTGNNNLIGNIVDCRYARSLSVQILTDGGAKVNWALQVTNMQPSLMNYNKKVFGTIALRDDTYTSAMWSTVNSGQIPTGAPQQGTIVTFSSAVHRAARITFNWDVTNGGGTTAHIFAVCVAIGGA